MVRSFVVQFHADARVGERRLAGRVEHLRTGDAVHIESLDELLRFREAHNEGDRDLSPGNPQLEEYQK